MDDKNGEGKIGKTDHQLYCQQTDEGAAYREEIISKLDACFDKEQGRALFEMGKVFYEEGKFKESAENFKKSALQGNGEGAFWYGVQLGNCETSSQS